VLVVITHITLLDDMSILALFDDLREFGVRVLLKKGNGSKYRISPNVTVTVLDDNDDE